MKGMIGLDIDGTITPEKHTIDPLVVQYLEKLASEGWTLFFITGRTFAWGYEVLQYLSCTYYFSVQNGAITLEMPSREVIAKKYLDSSILPAMDAICEGEASDYVLYTGYEYGDVCYYRPDRFSPEVTAFLKGRIEALKETWIPVDSFDQIPVKEFASVKCFGKYDDALRITQKIERSLGLHVPLIKDPYDREYFVVQGTRNDVSKGSALYDLYLKTERRGIIMAVGDDNNDISMLSVADVKIAMEDAPYELRKIADIIAPPCVDNGVITGLTRAIDLLEKRGHI